MDYLFELVELLNRYNEEDRVIENRIRDLICFICDDPTYMEKSLFRSVVFEAAEKLRMFGYIKGSIKINREEFDENNMFDIKHDTIQNYYRSKAYRNSLLDRRQKEVIDTFMNLEVKRILLSAPTSFGKTFLLREIIFINRHKYKNILLIFPTIALLNENTDNINELIKSYKLGYHVVNNIYTGIEEGNNYIFILTPERVLKLLADNNFLNIDFFFFDEIYKIDEDFDRNEDSIDVTERKVDNGNRAKAFRITLYLLSKRVKEYYLAGPYLNLKDVKSGMKKFLEINNITSIQIDFEPTVKIEYDAWKKNSVERHPILGERKKTFFDEVGLTTKGKIRGITNFLQKEKLGQAIFYCSTPAKSMDYTKELLEYFDMNVNSKIPKTFIEHLKCKYNVKFGVDKNSSLCWSLVKALEHGVGIHHGKFPKYIQNEVLKLFNERAYEYLFCTSTIIEGVNTNAKNVVVINNSVGTTTMTAFSLKNIKGRAGRYYHNYIGRIFYTDRKQREIEESGDMKLNFQTYDDISILKSDIDNANYQDLSQGNKVVKEYREEKFDKQKLPNEVFTKNRLYPRDLQERYLDYLLKKENFQKYKTLIKNSNNIKLFLSDRMINSILESFEETNIIETNKASVYHAVLSTYSIKGTLGILQYHIKQLQKDDINTTEEKIDIAYIRTFEQIRNIVEYEIPKLLCLFEALYQRAGTLLGYDMINFSMSAIIRYFELGITTELGLYLVEYGFPIDTIREIERGFSQISSLSAKKAITFIRQNTYMMHNIMDAYELDLFSRAALALDNKRP